MGKWVLFFNNVHTIVPSQLQKSFQNDNEFDLNVDYIAAKYSEQINIGYINCDSEGVLCKKHGITQFPVIKYVLNNVVHDYYGRKSLRSLVEMCDALSRMLMYRLVKCRKSNNKCKLG